MAIIENLPAFNGGEFSPRLYVRTDVDKYDRAARILRNMIAMPYGGIYRRPGLEYLGEAKNADKQCRLIPFNFSTTTRFVIELGETYMRFWSNGTQVENGSATAWSAISPPAAWSGAAVSYALNDKVLQGGAYYRSLLAHTSAGSPDDEPGDTTTDNDWKSYWVQIYDYEADAYVTNDGTTYRCVLDHIATAGTTEPGVAVGWQTYWEALSVEEVTTPYLEAELFDINFAQINDVVYFAHKNHPPYKLSRVADDDWTFALVDWGKEAWPPMLDFNTDTGLEINASGTGSVTTLNTNKDYFTAAMVGQYVEVRHFQDATSVNDVGAGSTAWITPVGEFTATLSSTSATPGWTGTAALKRKLPEQETADAVALNWYNNNSTGVSRSITVTGEGDGNLQYRWEYVGGNNAIEKRIEAEGGETSSLYLIDEYVSATQVKVTALKKAPNTDAVKDFAMGAFSSSNAYPRAVTLHEQRLYFAGNDLDGQRFWGSEIANYENFARGDEDSDAVDYTLGATENNKIVNMLSSQGLILFTTGGEWVANPGTSETEPISPSNIRVVRQSNYGSAQVAPLVVNDVVLFVSRMGRKIREFVYSIEKAGYVAPDLMLMSEHLSEGAITQTAFQQQRESVLWAVTGDGILAGMSYERDQQVVGWACHETDGTYESVASIYGGTGTEDEVWVCVKRNIAGQDKRYIERLYPGYAQFSSPGWETKEDSFYVDSGVMYDGVATTEITGLDHLNGKDVDVLGDGAVFEGLTVANGSITLPEEVSKCSVGLNYESVLKTMPLEVAMEDGTSQSREKHVHEVSVYFLDSLGLKFAQDEDGTFRYFPFRDTSDPMDASAPLYTGWHDVRFGGSPNVNGDITFKQDLPLPMTILALVPKYHVTADEV